MGFKLPNRSVPDAQKRKLRAKKVAGGSKKESALKSVLPKKSSNKTSKK